MKKIFLALMMLPLMLVSCLESNLDDIEVYDEADITSVHGMYYYYTYDQTVDGDDLFDRGNISRSGVDIDNEANTVTISTATPQASNIDQFDPKKVVMMLTISTAATIEPLDGSAILGVEADWTAGKANKYKVVAANGDTKIWTVTVNAYNVK